MILKNRDAKKKIEKPDLAKMSFARPRRPVQDLNK